MANKRQFTITDVKQSEKQAEKELVTLIMTEDGDNLKNLAYGSRQVGQALVLTKSIKAPFADAQALKGQKLEGFVGRTPVAPWIAKNADGTARTVCHRNFLSNDLEEIAAQEALTVQQYEKFGEKAPAAPAQTEAVNQMVAAAQADLVTP